MTQAADAAREASLVRKLLEQRRSWLELGDGLAVRVQRPAEAEYHLLRTESGPELARRFVVDWRGFSESALLGASVGSSDPLPFSSDTWATVCADHAEWLTAVVRHLVEAVTARITEREAARGNSEPSSSAPASR